MNDSILKEIWTLKGRLLGIGIENEDIMAAIKGNPYITNCDLLSNWNQTEGDFKKTSNHKEKSVTIFKLYKKYKKNTVDLIICDMDNVNPYQRYFLRDCFFIGKDKVCLLGKKKDQNVEELVAKVKRYHFPFYIKENKSQYLITVEKQNITTVKRYFYFGLDSINELLDQLGKPFNR